MEFHEQQIRPFLERKHRIHLDRNLVPPLSKKRLKRGEIAALDSNRGGSFGESCTNNGLTERVNERRRGEQRVERRRTSAMETGLRE